MWPMFLSLCLILSGKSVRKVTCRRRPAFRRPRLEALEDRALPSAYVVTTTADSGPGSLRDAINQINADTSHALYASPSNPSVDEIDFAITASSDTGGGFDAPTGVATIAPLSSLPSITNAVLINGYTQGYNPDGTPTPLAASPNTLLGPCALGSTDSTLHPENYGDNAVLKVDLDGISAGATIGLSLLGGNSTVEGLVISRFAEVGIHTVGTGYVIQGNFLGTDVTGTKAQGNGGADIDLISSQVTIGGTAPADRNVISAATVVPGGDYEGSDGYFLPSQGDGILAAAGNNSIVIQGNFIGTDVTGRTAFGNAADGINANYMDVTCVIGGSAPGAGNLISGNFTGIERNDPGPIEGNFIGTDVTGTIGITPPSPLHGYSNGIIVYGSARVGAAGAGNLISGLGNGYGIRGVGAANQIAGNFIGTNVTGTKAIGTSTGVDFQDGGSNNLIGGLDTNASGQPLAGDGNLISGNNGNGGVEIGGSGSSDDVVEGNYIGTDITGTEAIGNGFAGVILGGGADNNTVGGPVAAAANIIAYNGWGVFIGLHHGGIDVLPSSNSILGNSIHDNGNLGIQLDSGANNNQAAPVLTAATTASGSTYVGGALASVPDTTYRIEFFANTSPDPSGSGQGERYLGFVNVTTDDSGNADFLATLPGVDSNRPYLSATATRLDSLTLAPTDTSQFSNDVSDLASPAPYRVTTTADSGPGSLRDAINQINADTSHALYASLSNPSVDEIDFDITASSDTGGGYNATTGVATITPQSGLPSVTNSVLLDGYTQGIGTPLVASMNNLVQGDNAILKIQLDLSSVIPSEFGTGFNVLANNVTISGLVVNNLNNLPNNNPSAIWLQGDGDQVQGCFLGTDVSGSTVVGGTISTVGVAIFDSASSAVIGGTTPAARNLISGFEVGINEGYSGDAAGNSLVEGNYIGTDATGKNKLGNQTGVYLGGNGGIIGGLTSTPGMGAGNLISGNQTGIACPAGDPALIQGNLIGTDVTGAVALGNGIGIDNTGAGAILIGGNSIMAPTARNIISGNSTGIYDEYGPATLIEGNYIGTDITGTQFLGNSVAGLWLGGGTTLGGTDAGDGNVISGNPIGVRILGSDTVVQGNLIGTDYTGTKAVNQYAVGILAQDGGNNNVIGVSPSDPLAGGRNVISGNLTGISLSSAYQPTSGDVVAGNYIGTDITGRYAIGNGTGVVLGSQVNGSTIGGTAAAERNVISGNGLGIEIGFNGVGTVENCPSNNVVEGNYIGTDLTGTTTTGTDGKPLGNGVTITGGSNNTVGGTSSVDRNVFAGVGVGLRIQDANGGPGISVGGNGNLVQGNSFIQGASVGVHSSNNSVTGNAISGSSGDGVFVGDGATAVSILGNSIYANGGLGIQLDAASNANDNQAAPVLTAATSSGSGLTITGTLQSVTGTTFRIEFFANTTADPSGFGQGQTYLGFATATTDATGQAGFTASLPVLPAGQPFLSATATVANADGTFGDSSGFAQDLPVPTASAGGPYTISEGNSLTLAASGSSDPAGGALTYSWDVNGDGIFGDATGVSPTLTWAQLEALGINDGPATFNVQVQVTNPQGGSAISPATTLTVNDTPVSNLQLTLQAASISEDGVASLSGSFTNRSAVDANTVVISWGDGSSSTTVNLGAGVTSFSGITHQYLDNPAGQPNGSYTISATVSDGEGGQASAQTAIQVNNVAPTAAVSGPSNGVPGQPRTFTVSAADPSPTDQAAGFTYLITWGDGKTTTLVASAGNGAGVSLDHVYTAAGTYSAQVTATDKDGGTGAAATLGLTVQAVQMQGNTLAVGGTPGNDSITLSPADASGDLTVNLNGTTSFNGLTTFKPTDHILVYSQTGNDTITLASTKIKGTTYPITVPAFLYGGGSGKDNDTINAGGSTANNVLVGGAGANNTLTGGQGRDLLIAGLGAATLTAGSADDLLIGGWTGYADLTSSVMTYVQQLTELEAIMAEWGSSDSYATRVSDLSNGGGLNGSYLLNASTVHDNGKADTLIGTKGSALDWFFAGATDIIKNQKSGEVVTLIS
jgi:hypothetical protein